MKKNPKAAVRVLLILMIGMIIFQVLPFTSKNYRKKFDGDTSRSGLIDEKGFYSAGEKAVIDEAIRSVADETKMNIIIYLSGQKDYNKTDKEIEAYAADEYDRLCPKDMDGVFLYLDVCGKLGAYDVLSCCGKAGAVFTKSEREKVLDAACSNLPPSGVTVHKENIDKTISVFLLQLEKKTDNYSSGIFKWSYDKYTGKYAYSKGGKFYVTKTPPLAKSLIIIFLTGIIGFIVGYITYTSIKSKYKFKSSANPNVYVVNERSRLDVKTDTFVGTHTTKHKVQSNSGSSHHGGGRSFGGGGGHFSSGRHR